MNKIKILVLISLLFFGTIGVALSTSKTSRIFLYKIYSTLGDKEKYISENFEVLDKIIGDGFIDLSVPINKIVIVNQTTFYIDSSIDYTNIFTKGRAIKFTNNSGNTQIRYVVSSVYSQSPDKTTVEVNNTIPYNLSKIEYGLISNEIMSRYIGGSFESNGIFRGTNYYGKYVVSTVTSSSYSFDFNSYSVYYLTLSNNVTFSISAYPPIGNISSVVFILTASGADRNISFPSGWLWTSSTPTVISNNTKKAISVLCLGESTPIVVASSVDLY